MCSNKNTSTGKCEKASFLEFIYRSWFKTKIYPDFWETYANSFNKGYSLEHTRFVVFDTETTGLNPKQDRLL